MQIHAQRGAMAVGQKVKQLVYGLGALGGGAAILSQYYSNGDLGLDPRVHVARIRAQLRTYPLVWTERNMEPVLPRGRHEMICLPHLTTDN